MAKRDYYEILGVQKNATGQEIKKAYRKKAIQYHPDKNQNNKQAEENFKEAAEAYEILSHSEKKNRYDQFGHAGVGDFSGGGGSNGMTMEDIFSHFGDVFGDAFGGRFGGGTGGFGSRSGRQRHVNRGSNLRITVKLTLEEIAEGIEKKIKVNKYISCKNCRGSGATNNSGYSTCSKCKGSGSLTRIANTMLGQMQTTTTCDYCGGEGKIISDKCKTCYGEGIVDDQDLISLKIPAGVMEGMQLSVGGKGNAARRGGINGDLIVVIEEIEHKDLIRDENDLIYNTVISLLDAVLGTTIEIPTLNSKAKVKIEPGTQSEKILRLRGKGLSDINRYEKGDLLVKVNVWIPKNISKEEKNILEKLQESPNFTPDSSDKNFFNKMKNMF